MQVDRRRYRLDRWIVLPALNRIQGAEESIQIEPRVMRLLMLFIERAGDVVSREEILEAVWGDTIVGDDSLTRSVSDLRKLLGDDPQEPSVIETIRSVGYRLVAPVVQLDDGVDVELPADATPAYALNGKTERPDATHSARSARTWRWLATAAIVIATASVVFAVSRPAPSANRPALRVQPFTSLPGVEKSPALSPDGNVVAFIRVDRDAGTDDIFVKSMSSERIVNLTNSPHREYSPAWSPDGQHIAYARTLDGTCEIMSIPSLGGSPVRLTDCGTTQSPDLAWSPTGEWIAFTDQGFTPGRRAIFLISPETRERRQVSFPDQAEDHYPSFSPDGRSLSFARFTSARVADLFATDLTGNDAQRLTWDKHEIVGQAWTPDGDAIVFSSNRSGRRQLWTVSSTGGTAEHLSSVPTYDPVFPTFARTNHRFAFVEWYSDYNIWQISLNPDTADSVAAVPVAESTRWDRDPSFAPDGRRMAFTSNRSGSNELWIGDADGSDVARLTSFESGFVSSPRWAPDEEHIAFVRRAADRANLFVIDVATMQSLQLTDEEGDDLAPAWSRDGAFVYYGSNRGGAWRVWKVSARGGEPVPVTQEGGFTAQESVDGTILFFARNDMPGIWTQTAENGEATLILPSFSVDNWGNWAVVEDGIFFLDRKEADTSALRFLDFASGVVRTVRRLTPSVSPGASVLSLAPDGKSALITQIDWVEGDIMLVSEFE